MDVLKNKYGQHYFKKSNLHPTWGLGFKCIAFQEKQISRTNGIPGCIKFAGLKSIKIPSKSTVAIPGTWLKYCGTRCMVQITKLFGGHSNTCTIYKFQVL